MAPQSLVNRVKKPKVKWSMTVMMNAKDLSRDDDFLSHLLVEHLGTDESPLQVHKMDPSRRLPRHDPADIMAIIKKYIVRRGGVSTSAHRVKRAVDALLELPAVKQYLYKRSTAQINAFATHASRYFELYLPTGSIEISHTSRYSHRTGKSELCILATTPLKTGQVISDLKGSLAELTPEEDEELKKPDSRSRDGGIRKDFSVIHSNQKNMSHLFLGPARFVNHDCEHNVELFRDGRVITFRVIKPIVTGQEVTAHYGEGYFGKGNRHCLCESCERRGKGGYALADVKAAQELEDDSSTDEETREERIKAGLGLAAKGNPNERRTRRGVYAILPEEDTDNEDRIGASEAIGTQGGIRAVASNSNFASNNDPVPSATVVLSATALPAAASTSGQATPTHDDILVKNHDRRSSDTSSLTSLSEIERATASVPKDATISDRSQRLTPPSSLSSLSSFSSVPTHPPPNEPEISKSSSTPAVSRRTTRSTTALNSKAKSKDISTSSSTIVRTKETKAATRPETRELIRTRSTTDLEASNEPPKSAEKVSNSSARFGRKTRQSLNATIPSLLACSPNTKRSSSSRALSKSSTPTIGASSNGTSVTPKVEDNIPRCHTCRSQLRQLNGVKQPKDAVCICARCRRHFAIYGAVWPNRTTNLEALSSSDSDSSSAETIMEIGREKHKDAFQGQKLNKSLKYSVERPLKRHKTDSVLYATAAKAAFHHAMNQPRSPNGQFGGWRATSGKKYSSPFTREPLGYSFKFPNKKRNWGNIHQETELEWEEIQELDSDDTSTSSKTIRRMDLLPTLPVAKPLAALVSRPSPNLFARSAWGASPFINDDAPKDGEIEYEHKGLLGMRAKSLSKTGAEITSKPPITGGLKRKREPLPTDSKPKPKVGRTFYMKDEKKPMPKGWVLITDSSEETGEESEAAASAQEGVGVEENTNKTKTNHVPMKQSSLRPDPVSAITPSAAQTPSSRANSTPTQSSGTLVDEQNSVPPVILELPPLVAYPSKNTANSCAMIAAQSPSPKRRKLDGEGNLSLQSRPQGSQVEPCLETSLHDGSDTKVEAVSSPDITPECASPESSTSTVKNDNSVDDATNKKIIITFQEIHDSSELPVKQTNIANLGSSNTSVFKIPAVIEIPDSETKRIALQVSNLIHGTAFSYGHPDARSTWKPKYHYSEVDGWISDVGAQS